MKKTLSIIALLAVMFITVLGASAKSPKDSATAVFTVSPQMSCQNCENKIKSNIRFEKGVTDITTDLKGQTVTVTYNPAKTNPEKIVKAFKKIGYTATKADPSAAKAGSGCCKGDKSACGKCDKNACGKCDKNACGKCDKNACTKDSKKCSKKSKATDCCK